MQDHVVYIILRVSQGVNAITTSSLRNPAFLASQSQLFTKKTASLLINPSADMLAFEKPPDRTELSNGTQAAPAVYPVPIRWCGASSTMMIYWSKEG